MNVFRPVTNKRGDGNDMYCRFMLVSDEDRAILLDGFRGETVPLDQWVPWKIMRAYTTPSNLTKPLGDRAGIDFDLDPMVLSRRALEVLLPHIGRSGQVLPLAFAEAEYSFFNVTNVIDALDVEASELAYFKDGGLKRVLRHAFKLEVVEEQWIFKIPQWGKSTFVTDRFVDLVKNSGLTGFGFEQLWSDRASVVAAKAS